MSVVGQTAALDPRSQRGRELAADLSVLFAEIRAEIAERKRAESTVRDSA